MKNAEIVHALCPSAPKPGAGGEMRFFCRIGFRLARFLSCNGGKRHFSTMRCTGAEPVWLPEREFIGAVLYLKAFPIY